MSDIIDEKNDLFTRKLAVAPLKLLVMPNIKELGDKIDRYLVDFRKNRFPDGINDPEHQGYVADSYETAFPFPGSVPARARRSLRRASEARICIF